MRIQFQSIRTILPALLGASLSLSACGSGGGPDDPGLPVYPLTEEPFTGLQAVWEPLIPSVETLDAIDAGTLTVYDHRDFADAGLGVRLGEGIDWLELDDLAPGFQVGESGARRSLFYVWQAADPQVIDEESPIRIEAFDVLYRPNGHLSVQVFESHVRSARRISEQSGRPFDFALVAGDLADGGQRNEQNWVLTALNGGDVDPDSGLDDDPVPGPGNDYNDPFQAIGLGRPWYAAIGNHDALYNGGFDRVTDEIRAAAAGEEIYNFIFFPNGFCDGSTPDAELVTEGTTPADPDRVPLRREEILGLLQQAAGEPVGHGLTEADATAGRGYYSVHPLAGKPLRLLVLDTVNSEPEGIGEGSQGWCDLDQRAWLVQELTAAEAASELVMVLSHHRPVDFSSGSPTSGDEIKEILGSYPGMFLHVTGHGHANVKELVPPPAGSPEVGYWQLMQAAPLDFPMQSRIIEAVDEGNGYLSVYVTNLDHNAPVESLSHYARGLAAAKLAFGPATSGDDVEAYWQDELASQNLLLRIPIPELVREEIGRHEWPTRIESLETLRNFSGP